MIRGASAGVTLALRVQPGARKTALAGIYGEGPAAQLKVAVEAPALEGKANSALIALFSQLFEIPRRRVEIVSGELSRNKVLLLREVSLANAEEKLSKLLQPSLPTRGA